MEFNIQNYNYQLTFDKPIAYKSLIFYPVPVKNYNVFHYAIECIQIEKDKIADVKILSMDYLSFLMTTILSENGKDMSDKFILLFQLCCQITNPNDIQFLQDEKGKFTLKINNEIYTGKDFDYIRNIILYQNIANYKQPIYIDPDLEEVIKEVERIKSLSSNSNGSCSLESQIDAVQISTSYTREYIEDLPIRRFVKLLQRIDAKLHYQVYMNGKMSGVEFKQEPIHWTYEENKNELDGKFVRYDSFEEKMKHVT